MMELDKLLIGIILISMVAVGLGGFVVDITGRYGTKVSPEFQTQFNKFNESYTLTEAITEDVKLGGVEQGETDNFDLGESIKAGINVVKTVFVQGIPTLFSSVTSIASTIPVPEFVTRGLQAITLISIAFALVYLYFRYKNQ